MNRLKGTIIRIRREGRENLIGISDGCNVFSCRYDSRGSAGELMRPGDSVVLHFSGEDVQIRKDNPGLLRLKNHAPAMIRGIHQKPQQSAYRVELLSGSNRIEAALSEEELKSLDLQLGDVVVWHIPNEKIGISAQGKVGSLQLGQKSVSVSAMAVLQPQF